MNNKVNEQLTDFLGGSGNAMVEQFIAVLELPDKQFDAIYPDFKAKIAQIFNSKSFQSEALKNIDLMAAGTYEDTKAEMEQFIAMINEDDSLSANKKEILTTIITQSVEAMYSYVDNPREKVNVKIVKLSPNAILPTYAHESDAGADVYAIEDVTLKPHVTKIIKTGIAVAIPKGYEIQVRPRSGLSAKTSLRIANSVGTIDPNFRGEIGIIMENTGNLSYTIKRGDKIAQLVISPIPMIVWNEVTSLDDTDRGKGGFGSTDEK